jgi:hypothetical protein
MFTQLSFSVYGMFEINEVRAWSVQSGKWEMCVYALRLEFYVRATIERGSQNYRVSGFCPSSEILNNRKHNVSKTGSLVPLYQ